MENKKIGLFRVLYLLKRLNKLVILNKKNRIFYFIFFIVVLIQIISPLIQNYYFGQIINVLSKGSFILNNYFIIITALSLLFKFLPSMFLDIEMFMATKGRIRMLNIFDVAKIEKRLSLDLAILEDRKFNDLFQRVGENGSDIYSMFFNRQFYLLSSIINMIIPFIILTSLNWILGLIILISITPRAFLEYKYSQSIYSKIATKYAEERRKQSNHYQNFLGSKVLETKIYNLSKFFKDKILKLLDILFNSQIQEENKKIKLAILANLLSISSFGVSILYYLNLVIEGKMQIGTIVFVISAIGALQSSSSYFFGMISREFQDAILVDDFIKYLDIENNLKQPLNPKKITENTPVIEFKNVSFKYPETDKFVLKNINLKINPGEKIAIIGVNGAGKTTFTKLLCRFYDPDKGEVLIDNKNIKDINIDHFYKKTSILFQDFAKHTGITIKEAIFVGDASRKLDIKKMEKSAKISSLNESIKDFELGYNSMLGKSYKNGVELSGGQWQKLALAKVFYRDPQIYILDEPTASIDAEAEADIFNELDKLPKDKTVIFISHRFSTVRKADRIIVIDGGTIKEQGSHNELMSIKNGIYNKLFTIQAKEYIRK